MAKDRSKTPDDEHGSPSKKDRKYASDSEPDSRSESDDRSKKSERSRSRSRSNRKRSRSRSRSSSRKPRDSDDDSYTSSSSESDSDSYSDSESGRDEDYSESEGERKRRKRRERKRREEKERRRRKEKEKKRRRKEREEKEERTRKKKKEKKMKMKKKKRDKEKGKKGAVTDLWGKYGIIRETDMWNKRPEFTAWLAEVKQVNLESLPNWEEKQMFKEFMEDHNTATFPSKKYYDLDAYHMRKMEKEVKRGSKYVQVAERTVFNDEEQRRQEMMQERERQKEEQIEALKVSMQSGMAQAMKEQAQLKEEMAYQYKIGNFEAAAAIQRRLDPDVAM